MREKLKVLPGVQVVMAQPISDRVDEMVTGVRSDIAVKVFGDDLDQLKQAWPTRSPRSPRPCRARRTCGSSGVSGQQYLSIDIDRQAIARHGMNVSDVNDVIETAIGGKVATEIYEGERRFSGVGASCRSVPQQRRGDFERPDLTSPNGAQVPLGDVANISVHRRPGADFSREMGKRRIVVGVNVRDRDLGGFVAELQQKVVASKIKLPEGYYLEWGGQFQNMERALGHLKMIIPMTIAAIFFLLFMLFNSLRFATLIILVLPFASIGGIIGLFVSRRVPVGAGLGRLHRAVGHRGAERRGAGVVHPQPARGWPSACAKRSIEGCDTALPPGDDDGHRGHARPDSVPVLDRPGFRGAAAAGDRRHRRTDHLHAADAGGAAHDLSLV